MRRKQIQPKRSPRSGKTPRKRSSKATRASLAETLLNWLIVILVVVILGFAASIIWRFAFAEREAIITSDPGAKRGAESIEIEQKAIRIEVLNGCGVKGVAAKFRDYLRAKGFDVVNTDNYRSFDVDSSFVIDRVSIKSKYGLKIAEALGIPQRNVKPILSDELSIESTVVLGKDYSSLKGLSEPAQK